MKYIKRFFLVLLILLFLSGAAVFVLITFYKKELTSLLAENLRTNYGLDLKVEDISVSFFSNWPHASVKLKDVCATNSLHPSRWGPLFKARSVSLSFNLEKMMHKEFEVKYISLDGAELNLVRNEDGTRNFELKKPPADTSVHSGISFEVNKVSIRNTQFRFMNRQRKQDVSVRLMDITIRLDQYADGLEGHIKGKTLVEGLLFNEKNGAFLRNTPVQLDLGLNYLYCTRTVCFYAPSQVEIEGHAYQVTSLIRLGENRRLALRIESEKIKCERVAALLTPKIRKVMSNFEVKRPVDAKLLLVANLAEKEDPVIIADIIGKNCDLAIGNSKIPYSGLYFTGRIRSLDSTCQRGDLDRASVVFRQIRGKVYQFPFAASVHVQNLTKPDIDIKADLRIEANKIPYELARDFVLKGSATAHVSYKGPANKLNKKEFLQSPMVLTALIDFNNLSYKELERPYVYTINGKASLNNSDLQFENLGVKTDIAAATVKGRVEGFVPYLFGFSRGFRANISAQTAHLDLNPLFVESGKASEVKKASAGKTAARKIDQGQFEFNVNLFAKKLVVRKVEASNASVDLAYKGNSLNIKSAALATCEGKITAKAYVKDFTNLDADLSVQDVNVKVLFEQFENFGQEAIVSSNLQGHLSVEAKFKAELDEKMNLKPETMYCDAKLKLVNGHLVNYEPVQSLSNFLFRNRDFNDVSFTELNETFKLRGYEMQIDELEIGSNILNLYVVNGLYNFKGNSNVNILIPWSNLKKRGRNYIPQNTGESAENTKGVKLNFNGPSKKMKISLGHKDQSKRFS